ncbi:hypothetical protein GOBAR_DD11622 [Gossypium barbadense]|nr:hypothetical protein GOBAR_DD11622 [Gossypium barbadense]
MYSDDSERLDSAHESDSDGQNWLECNPDNDMSNPRLKIGMLFKSKDSLKEPVKQYGRSEDTKFVFTTKWLPQLNNRLPQISKRVPQLSRKLPPLSYKLPKLINNLPQLTKKMLPQEKSSH